MQLEDTMCKLIRTVEDMSTISKTDVEKSNQIKNNSVEEYVRYHQLSLENVAKQKDEEIKKLKYVLIVRVQKKNKYFKTVRLKIIEIFFYYILLRRLTIILNT